MNQLIKIKINKNIYLVLVSIFCTINLAICSINVNYKTIQLSYIQSDRAAAVLKSLGYNVVDYTAMPGPNPHELLFEPGSNFDNNLRNSLVNSPEDLPIIIVMPETQNITLLEMQGAMSESDQSMNVDMGGSSLVHATTAEPLQRLMIGYDKQNPEVLARLLNVLLNEIDVSAKQIIIEALVVEVESNKVNEMGVNLNSTGSIYDFSTSATNIDGSMMPFNFIIDKSLIGNSIDFDAKLNALISSQSANILSRPSVLVLDGRQARIVIGQQIPISKSVLNGQNITSSTEYIPIGIVLNIRPRINRNDDKITMQVETIISEVSDAILVESVLEAPAIDSRKVQTYVQVANNTPFIIGGLTSNKKNQKKSNIPLISSIPLIGKIFNYKKESQDKKEIIIVITPHIIDVENKDFTRLIPKDDDLFHSLDNMLFKNIYRIQNKDVFDLGFITNTNLHIETINRIVSLKNNLKDDLLESEYNLLLDGGIPGEEILIRRMLYNIIERSDYYKHINPKNVIYFESDDDNIYTQSFYKVYNAFIKERETNEVGLLISIEHSISNKMMQNVKLESKIKRPIAHTSNIKILKNKKDYKQKLKKHNLSNKQFSIILQNSKHERRLYEILILRRVLEMNPGILNNISNFSPGLEIVFPSSKAIESDTHVIDSEVAKYFYEINLYNYTFDKKYIDKMDQVIDSLNN